MNGPRYHQILPRHVLVRAWVVVRAVVYVWRHRWEA